MIDLIDTQKESVIALNKTRLVPIIKTIIFAARLRLPLRGHRDNEDLKSAESITSCLSGQHGVFRGLLAFRIDSGDQELQEHFKTAGQRTMMTSPTIQNDVQRRR